MKSVVRRSAQAFSPHATPMQCERRVGVGVRERPLRLSSPGPTPTGHRFGCAGVLVWSGLVWSNRGIGSVCEEAGVETGGGAHTRGEGFIGYRWVYGSVVRTWSGGACVVSRGKRTWCGVV